MDNSKQQIPSRSCDGCALCCMVLKIDELRKPMGKWCNHCSTRKTGRYGTLFLRYATFLQAGEQNRAVRRCGLNSSSHISQVRMPLGLYHSASCRNRRAQSSARNPCWPSRLTTRCTRGSAIGSKSCESPLRLLSCQSVMKCHDVVTIALSANMNVVT